MYYLIENNLIPNFQLTSMKYTPIVKYLLSRKLLSQILLTLSATCFVWSNPWAYFGQNAAATPISNSIFASSMQTEQPVEPTTSESTIPVPVQAAVLEAAARRTSRTVAEFKIVNAEQRDWSDGCLGIAEPDELCTQAITPGWLVVVTDGQRNWTYRTDDSGDRVKLDRSPR